MNQIMAATTRQHSNAMNQPVQSPLVAATENTIRPIPARFSTNINTEQKNGLSICKVTPSLPPHSPNERMRYPAGNIAAAPAMRLTNSGNSRMKEMTSDIQPTFQDMKPYSFLKKAAVAAKDETYFVISALKAIFIISKVASP